MVFPRVIVGMILFQLTMLGLFILKDSYVLGAFCVPLVVLTLVFKYTIDAAYFRNSFHLPMQLLREQEKIEQLSDPAYNHSHSNNDNAPGNDGKGGSGDLITSTGKQDSSPGGRWTSALDSIQNTTRQRLDKSGAHQHEQEDKSPPLQPRQRRMILDEDNYKAAPNDNTDYRQPPMYLNPGVLDTGLKWYGNPYLVGELPHLWLPVKATNSSKQTTARPPQVPQLTTTAPGQSAVYTNGTSGDVNNKYMRRQQSSTTAMDVAQVIRQMEASYEDSLTLDQVMVHDGKASQQEPPPISKRPSVSILGALSSFGSFEPFALRDNKTQQNNSSNSDHDIGEDKDDEDSDIENSDDDNHSKSAYHRIYYHHPSLRHSSASVNRIPSSSTNRLHVGSSPLLNQSISTPSLKSS
jgi:hypothetical protein